MVFELFRTGAGVWLALLTLALVVAVIAFATVLQRRERVSDAATVPTGAGHAGVRTSEALLAAAPDWPAEASLVCDAKRHVTWCNAEFTRMTGYTLEDMVGRTCAVLQGKGTDSDVVQQIRAALDRGENYRGALVNYRRDGSPFWNYLTIHPVRDSEGTLVNFISVQRDVTLRAAASDG